MRAACDGVLPTDRTHRQGTEGGHGNWRRVYPWYVHDEAVSAKGGERLFRLIEVFQMFEVRLKCGCPRKES